MPEPKTAATVIEEILIVLTRHDTAHHHQHNVVDALRLEGFDEFRRPRLVPAASDDMPPTRTFDVTARSAASCGVWNRGPAITSAPQLRCGPALQPVLAATLLYWFTRASRKRRWTAHRWCRYYVSEDNRTDDTGFRCAKDVSE